MNTQTANALIQVRETFDRRIASLEAAIAANKPGTMIFAWSHYGIGVLIAADGPRVVGVELATIVRANDRRAFCNGANKPAAIVDRATALAEALAMTRNTLSAVLQHAA